MFKDNKQLTFFFAVVTVALFALVIAGGPASDSSAGLATKDFFDAKETDQSKLYRDRLGISYKDFARKPTQRDLQYQEQKLAEAIPDPELRELYKSAMTVDSRNALQGGAKDNCEVVTQEMYDQTEGWPNSFEMDGGCFELGSDLVLGDRRLEIGEEGELYCNGNEIIISENADFTFDTAINTGHASIYDCTVSDNLGVENVIVGWGLLQLNNVEINMYQGPPANEVNNHAAVLLFSNALIDNLDINGYNNLGYGLYSYDGGFARYMVVDGLEVTDMDIGLDFELNWVYEATSFTDIDLQDNNIGVNMQRITPWDPASTDYLDTSVYFSDVRSCDNDLDWSHVFDDSTILSVQDFIDELGNALLGEVEFTTHTIFNEDTSETFSANMYPGLEVSSCSPYDEVVSEEDWSLDDTLGDGDNDDDDGDDWEAEEPSGIFTSG